MHQSCGKLFLAKLGPNEEIPDRRPRGISAAYLLCASVSLCPEKEYACVGVAWSGASWTADAGGRKASLFGSATRT